MCRREGRREKKVEIECFSDHVDVNIHLAFIITYRMHGHSVFQCKQTDISGGVLDAPAV